MYAEPRRSRSASTLFLASRPIVGEAIAFGPRRFAPKAVFRRCLQRKTPAGEGGRCQALVLYPLRGDGGFLWVAQHVAAAPDGFDVVLAGGGRGQFLAQL